MLTSIADWAPMNGPRHHTRSRTLLDVGSVTSGVRVGRLVRLWRMFSLLCRSPPLSQNVKIMSFWCGPLFVKSFSSYFPGSYFMPHFG